MKSILLLCLGLIFEAEAFLPPQKGVRTTSLNLNAGDMIKRSIKFVLVPNSKMPTPSPTPAPVVVAPVPAPVAPPVIEPVVAPPAPVVSTYEPPVPEPAPFPNPLEGVSDDMQSSFSDAVSSLKEKLTTSASSGGSTEQVTTSNLIDYIKEKQAQIGGFQINEERMKDLPKFDSPDFEAIISNVKAAVALIQSGSASFDDIKEALDTEQYGGWYLGIAGFLTIALASLSGNSSSETVPAATPVATPSEATPVPEAAVDKTAVLEDQVRQLSEALTKVSTELKEVKATKASKDYELATFKSDMRSLQSQLTASESDASSLRVSLKKIQSTMEKEKVELEEKLAVAVKENAAFRERLSPENVSKDMKDLQAKISASEKERASLLNKIESVMDEIEKAGVAPPKSKPKKSPTKAVAKEETPFFSSISEPAVPPVAEPPAPAPEPQKAAPKKATKKAAPKEAEEKAPAKAPAKAVAKASPKKADAKTKVDSDDWSELSDSTIKRKTVKELVDYLESRGKSTTDESGKTLKKDLLVKAVKA